MAKKEKENKTQKRHFFKDMKAELKKVIWPTPKQTANNTIAVIAFTLAVALIVFVLDVCFEAINKNGVVALQEKVKSSYSASAADEGEASEEEATTENSENTTNVEVQTTTDESKNTESQE